MTSDTWVVKTIIDHDGPVELDEKTIRSESRFEDGFNLRSEIEYWCWNHLSTVPILTEHKTYHSLQVSRGDIEVCFIIHVLVFATIEDAVAFKMRYF